MVREHIFDDRSMTRARVLALTAVTTLAVGIGLSTGVLAVAYGVLLRPLVYAEPSSLVALEIRWGMNPGGDIGTNLEGVDEWRRRTRALSAVAGHSDAEITIRGTDPMASIIRRTPLRPSSDSRCRSNRTRDRSGVLCA